MAFSDICCDMARRMGRVTGRTFSGIPRFPRKLARSDVERQSLSDPDQVRSIVVDELTRLLGVKGTITRTEFEERLRHMVESILALQRKIEELSVHGPISEAALSEAIASVSAAESLGDEERSVLAGIFRQNIAIQKPELANSFIGDSAP